MASTAQETRRLNVNLSQSAAEKLDVLASAAHTNKTELVKMGLGLVSLGIEERQKQNRLAVVSSDGRVLKEIILPVNL